MNLKTFFEKPRALAFVLFLIAILPRVLSLDKIPVGIVHDNMIFALNSEAVFHTGRDVTGLWHPLAFSPIPDEPAQAELIYTVLAPTVGLFQSPLFAAHIFHAICNALLAVVIFFIVLKLLGKWPAVLSGLVVAFNPWNIFFGRSAFEASLAAFFYVLGFYVLLHTKQWKKFWALLPLALGFYTYMAYKVTFLPYVIFIAFFTWNHIDKKKYTKQYLVLLGVCVFIFLSFLANLQRQSTKYRLHEASFFKSDEIVKQVDSDRQFSLDNPLSSLFSNKATIAAKTMVTKYIGAFSPEYLFIRNELTQRFHLYNHGYFYYLDFVFLLIGFCYLFAYKRKLWLMLTSIILISPLPSVVSTVETSYAMRSSLYIPFLCIFIGVGIWYSLSLLKRKYLIFSAGAITILYLFLIANFFYTYFFIQPVVAAEGAAFSARTLSKYVQIANQQNKQVTVVSKSPKVLFKDFIYYTNAYNKQTSHHFKETFLNRSYTFQNVSFQTCRQVKKLEKEKIYVFDPGEKCAFFKNSGPTVSSALQIAWKICAANRGD